MSAIVASGSAPPDDCAQARKFYESLEPERAIESAAAALDQDGTRPLACLEVKAVAHLILGQLDQARVALREVFERAPAYTIEDPSLSPGMRETIESERRAAQPLRAMASARWLVHEALRVDFELQGGLRGAERIRYTATIEPSGERRSGDVPLVGRAATATVAVSTGAPADRVVLSGAVVDGAQLVLRELATDLPLLGRPAAPVPETVVVETGGIGWPLWVGIGVVAAAAIATIVIVTLPTDFSGDGSQGILRVPE